MTSTVASLTSARAISSSDRCYDDTTINSLLSIYFSGPYDIKILKALPLSHENDITSELLSDRITVENVKNASQYFIPININSSHWVGLFIDNTKDSPLVFWIDPFGGIEDSRRKQIAGILNGTGMFSQELSHEHIHFNESCMQNDTDNCGPWIIEILRHVRQYGGSPVPGEIDIEECRMIHQNALDNIFTLQYESDNTFKLRRSI